MLASGFFLLLKKLRYYECNPEADWEDMEKLHPAHGPHRSHLEGQRDNDRDDTTEARTP
jgi:aquaporin related protein